MRISKILIMFVLIILLFGTIVRAAEEPEITATSAVVVDCIDGKILYSKNMEERLYPASLTNVMVAILVLENCNMEDDIKVSESAINNVEQGYLTANIKAGEVFKVEELLNLLLISSYHDVSNVFAEHIAGNVESFVEMMNNKAKEIGCKNSSFVNNTGAHDTNHYSTAYDMALIAKYAMQYDEIKEAQNKIYYELRATDIYTKSDRLYQASNEMILRGKSNYYRYAKGIKTSFTTPAGYCVMTYSEKNDIPLVSVVMKATTSDSRYEDAKKILEYSYDNNTIKTIATLGTNIQTLNIKNGTSKTKKLNLVLGNTVKAVVNIENKDKLVEPKISIKENLKAPIEKGEVVGEVDYEIEGKIYTSTLVAQSDVKKSYKGIIFIILFLLILTILGSLRIVSIRNRNIILNKIRNKK